jgi:glycine cleavage system H protein
MAFVAQYEFPDDLWYDAGEHLWLRVGPDGEETIVTVGVDALGQDALGEVVRVQFVEPGRRLVRGDAVGSLDAETMVRSVFAPVTGMLLETNPEVVAAPRLLNVEPYGRGWLFRLRCDAWASERQHLLHDEMSIVAWVRAEMRAAQP